MSSSTTLKFASEVPLRLFSGSTTLNEVLSGADNEELKVMSDGASLLSRTITLRTPY